MSIAISEVFIFINIMVVILLYIYNFLIHGEKRKVIMKRETKILNIITISAADI